MSTIAPETMLWASDSRGVFIPQYFATSFTDRAKYVKGVSDENWAILEAGPTPENEQYWDAWTEVLDNATVTDQNGYEYSLQQDGDLWLVPKSWVWDEDEDKWVAPDTLKDCGICGGQHPNNFTGDCRDDANRHTEGEDE